MENKVKPEDMLVEQVFRVYFFDKKKEWIHPVDILATSKKDALKKLESIKITNYTPYIEGVKFNRLLDELSLVLRNKIIQNGFIKYKRER